MMRSPTATGLPIHSDGSSNSAMPSCGASTRARCNCSARKAASARFSSILPVSRASWDFERASVSACWAACRYSASAVARAWRLTSSLD